jgi:Fe-S-cluster-containing hydrogenase component 2
MATQVLDFNGGIGNRLDGTPLAEHVHPLPQEITTTMTGDMTPFRALLRHDKTLTHNEGACLPLRSRHGQCRACADQCPVQALEVTLAEVRLSEACTGCGQCTAVCPTEALSLPEMDAFAKLQFTSEHLSKRPTEKPIRLECRKVPQGLRAPGSLELPCLGALRASHLLALTASGHHVEIVDRGWCHACSMNRKHEEVLPGHPAKGALDMAQLWLEAAQQEAHQPRLLLQPLPLEQCPEDLPASPKQEEKLDRRRFFRQALDRPAGRASALPMGGDGKAAYPADQRQPSPDRERLLASMVVLTELSEQALPAELFPQMHVSSNCCDHRLCVALCPTAALSVHDNGMGAHLSFSSDRCIDCGTCIRACPDGAIQMQSTGGQRGAQTVYSHARMKCTACADTFTPTAAQTEGEAPLLCMSCAKSQRFMDDARRQLFGNLK